MNLFVSLMALAAWAAWGYTVLFVDPRIPMAPLVFYAALFLALTCTLALLMGAGGASEGGEPTQSAASNLGHAAVVSTLLLFALWLQSLRMLTPLSGILLAAMFLFIELGFLLSGAGRRPRARRRPRRSAVAEAGPAAEQ